MQQRRRKQRYTWLPTLGTDRGENPTINIRRTLTNVDWLNDEVDNVVTPVVFDEPIEAGQASVSDPMGWLKSNEYVIERIVGNIFCSFVRGLPTQSGTAICGAGLFVAKCDNEDPAQPLGGGTNFGVFDSDNIMEPWIWRRTWVLTAPQSLALTGTLSFPPTNVAYGTAVGGPFLDSRVGRRVSSDDRLWAVFSSYAIDDQTASVPSSINWTWDLRVLGAMRRARNKSAF